MICETYYATMQHIGFNRSHAICWCPRCGTIKDESPSGDPVREAGVPKLVERCRTLELMLDPVSLERWKSLGVADSINLPENRP